MTQDSIDPSSGYDTQVAIVGGGIVGLILAMGLVNRGIKVQVYEQASGFREIGAGVAFTANAIRCMGMIDSKVVTAVRAVATPNGDPDCPTDYLQYVDGFHGSDEVLFRLDCGYRGFEGCHRAHLLDELAKHVEVGMVCFGKRLGSLSDTEFGVRLCFEDGTSAHALAVVGCDGIKSTVRRLLFGDANPVSYPHFSHKVAYRALVPMDKAEAALGNYKARHQHMHIGPGAHLLHFPVAGQTLMNLVAFVDEPNDWPENNRTMVAPGSRADVTTAFASWGNTAKALVSLFPAQLDKWAIFDTYDHPLPVYSQGRICLAGDAAHAAAPHHGAGAGIGIEDALALCTLLERTLGQPQLRKRTIEDAFVRYSDIRRERSQWLVKSSREVCDIYEWRHPEIGENVERCRDEITERSHRLWYFDIEGMLAKLSC